MFTNAKTFCPRLCRENFVVSWLDKTCSNCNIVTSKRQLLYNPNDHWTDSMRRSETTDAMTLNCSWLIQSKHYFFDTWTARTKTRWHRQIQAHGSVNPFIHFRMNMNETGDLFYPFLKQILDVLKKLRYLKAFPNTTSTDQADFQEHVTEER